MNNINLVEILGKLGVQYVPFLFALCFHEYAHGWMARRKGDNTAELMGRLTMNPFAHADLVGTFILPIAGILMGVGGLNGGQGLIFGWAKPVPVNGRNLSKPKEDMFWIALAGPLANLFLAAVAITAYILSNKFMASSEFQETAKTLLVNFVMINMLLFTFNLIPLHPLDGGKVIARFIPENWNRYMEDNQMTMNIILIMFFVSGGFRYLMIPIGLITDAMFTGISSILQPIL